MAQLRYTARAELDLDSIAAYTLETWGYEQAVLYLRDLKFCCERLADDPTSGRVHQPRPQYWRFEHAKHVVFFRRDESGNVVIVRVLHGRMLPDLRLTDEIDD